MMTTENEKTVQSIIEIRLNMDKLLNSFKLLQPSREVSLAKTSLQFAFAWLGESMKLLGSETPYVESNNPASDKIEPQAEHTENDLEKEFSEIEYTQVAKVKLFRLKLKDIIDSIEQQKRNYGNNLEFNELLQYAIKSATEAKFSFGWELGRIRDESNKPQLS